MASALAEQREYKKFSETYSRTNEFQVKFGKEFVDALNVKPGDKVLDMGCGTGELTTYIAAQVGEEGRVVGVDPDEERITVATEKHLNNCQSKLSFVSGESSSHFPHFNEEYYDIHFSNLAFQWLTSEEKALFMKTAMQCLKPGGRIAILSTERLLSPVEELLTQDQIENGKGSPLKLIPKIVAESMLRDSGFLIQRSEFKTCTFMFPSTAQYVTWYCASLYIDESIILPEKRRWFAEKYAGEDGRPHITGYVYQIVAKKPN